MRDLNQEFGIVYYKTAKLAKEKGFNGRSNYYYIKSKTKLHYSNFHQLHLYDNIAAPTQSNLQKYLREKHNIIVEVLIFDKGFLEMNKFCYQYRVYNNSMDWITGLEFKTYEEALEKGIYTALNLIKDENNQRTSNSFNKIL